VWIDGDRRATPDGSSFAWQHWSHTFEYALAAGPGDWRSAGFPAAGQDYNRDLLACVTGLHDGLLPATASLAAAEPATALICALKPRGNPLDPVGQPSPGDGVTVRLRDTSGGTAATRASVRLWPGIAAASSASLTEEPSGPPLPVEGGAARADLPPSGTVTVVLTPDGAAAQAAAPADPAEPVQPVFTRYWLHGKGPAPAGNLPVAVHLSPARTALAGPGSAAALRLTVACGPAAASGTVRLDGGGLALDPAGPLEYDLGPRGHAGWDVTAAVLPGPQGQPGTGPGRYFVTARTAGDDGQVFEDAVLVSVGEPPPPRLDLPLDELIPLYQADTEALAAEVDLQLLTRELVLRPGEAGEITATLRNGTASPIRGEAQLVSPFGSWAGGQPWTQAFAADAGAQVTLTFQVTQPAAARGGQHWWALVKVMYFGRARYTDPVAVRIATE
jgi:hypothetical protein